MGISFDIPCLELILGLHVQYMVTGLQGMKHFYAPDMTAFSAIVDFCEKIEHEPKVYLFLSFTLYHSFFILGGRLHRKPERRGLRAHVHCRHAEIDSIVQANQIVG